MTANGVCALVTAKRYVSAGKTKPGWFKVKYLRGVLASHRVHVNWGGGGGGILEVGHIHTM